jgi:SSS family solute:Na+ symporter
MNLHWIDWSILIAVVVGVIAIGAYSKRYVRGVADFMAANRLAGRYLLSISVSFGGAITLVAGWEMVYRAGLPTHWWAMMSLPVGLLIVLTGFVIYRFRQTRALTLAQFLEMRYSRRFRLFAGTLCWLSGVFNYGVFPAVTARFIIYFFGLPASVECFGLSISMFPLVMFTYLAIAVYTACAGGQIGIMLTGFFTSAILMVIFVVMMFFFLFKFDWDVIMSGLSVASEGKSMINPFKTGAVKDFNVFFFLIGIFGTIYGTRAWQGNSGQNAAARTPHEAVLSGIITTWRGLVSGLVLILIPICAYAVMHLPQFADIAAPVTQKLAGIKDPMLQSQMTVPLVLAELLPVGLMGMFAVVVASCAICCDNGYLHSWGTILIQDVITPMRGKPFDKKNHMLLLRLAIVGVAAFGFTFSMLFPLKDFILMYFALTGAIYLGGAGSVIIGGLYWDKGTTPAAWTALLVGTILGFGGLLVQQVWAPYLFPCLLEFWPDWSWLAANKEKFPLNGQLIYFIAMITALLSYILISLFGPRKDFNMDKMLRRGQYAIADDVAHVKKEEQLKKRRSFSRLIGITSEFNRFERFLSYSTFGWTIGWWVIFIIGTVLSLTTDLVTDKIWQEFWWWRLVPFAVVLGTFCSGWIIIGGLKDAKQLFHDLRHGYFDENDDGSVSK